MSMNLTLPERWLPCPRKGKLIADLFLPCKTPLDDRYNNLIEPAARFTPEMLISSTRKENCGLVIDLTFTSRFYNNNIIKENDLEYCKIACRGRGSTPDEESIREFFDVVNDFRSSHPNKRIIVHCTHGFNRTGFLIILYLIRKFSWNPQEAIQAFAESRSPGIYKQDYLDDLCHLFHIQPPLSAPDLPSWCLTEPSTLFNQTDKGNADESSNHTSNAAGQKRKRPGMNNSFATLPKVPKFMEGVRKVASVTREEEIAVVHEALMKICNFKSNKFPGSQPVSMDLDNVGLLKKKPYMVSWKADGTRYMMLILGEKKVYMVDRDNCVYYVNNLRFPKADSPLDHLSYTLLDGEMVIDRVGNEKYPRYLIYDIINYEGEDIGKKVTQERFKYIADKIISPRTELMRRGQINKEDESFSVRQKQFWDLSTIERLLDGSFKSQLSHDSDGLIFQPAGVLDFYHFGRCDSILKWKPPELNTIDFLIEIETRHNVGCLPERVGTLYAADNAPGSKQRVDIIPQMALKEKCYSNKIVECFYDHEKKRWVIMRERTDKSVANHISTVQAVLKSIIRPLTKDILYKFIHNEVLPKKMEIASRDRVESAKKLQEELSTMNNLSNTSTAASIISNTSDDYADDSQCEDSHTHDEMMMMMNGSGGGGGSTSGGGGIGSGSGIHDSNTSTTIPSGMIGTSHAFRSHQTSLSMSEDDYDDHDDIVGSGDSVASGGNNVIHVPVNSHHYAKQYDYGGGVGGGGMQQQQQSVEEDDEDDDALYETDSGSEDI